VLGGITALANNPSRPELMRPRPKMSDPRWPFWLQAL
jgi:hypothetical protein